MRIFFWGQIKEVCRGDLAGIVYVNPLDQVYYPSVHQMNSDPLIDLTGMRAASYPISRLYIGISKEAGDRLLASTQDRKVNEVNLRDLDDLIAVQYFVRNDINSAKPKRVTLESTEEGYVVV